MSDEAGPSSRRRWTEARVVEALIALSRRGVPLTFRGLRDAGEHRLFHMINHYGGLPRLRRLAGLPRPRRGWHRCSTTPDGVKREIRLRHERQQPLAWSAIPPALQAAAQAHFGSWYAAVTAAGLDFDRATRSTGKDP